MGKFQLGSYQHKKLFCELISENDRDSTIDQLPWPTLDAEAVQKLADFPWRSLGQERIATAQIIRAFGLNAKGSLLKDAIATLAAETQQQGQFLHYLIEFYQLPDHSALPINIDDNNPDFKQVQHRTNLYLFLASGLYDLANRSGYLPAELLSLFNQQLDQQARHVLFFINWLSFETQVKQKPEYEGFGLFSLWYQRAAIWNLLTPLNRSEYDDNLPRDPTPTDYFMGQWTIQDYLQACCQTYLSKFEPFDDRLLRPSLLPKVAKFGQTFLGFWPTRTDAPRQSSV